MQKTTVKTKLLTALLTLCMLLSLVPLSAFAAGVNYIQKVSVAYEYVKYKAGEAPRATASVTEGNCTVAYEYWREIYQKEEGGVWSGTGRYWYSDSDKMASLSEDKRITKFEAGHHYSYNIVLVTNSGYFFSDDETVVSVGEYEWGTPGGHTNLAIKEMSTELRIYSPYAIDLPDESKQSAVTAVDIDNVKLNYQPGDTARPTARRTGAEQNKYDILYESWGKRVKDANDTITTVAYWYSDESCYSDGDARFNTFEKGGRYQYSVRLKAKDGYIFDSNLSKETVTLNGQALPSGSWVNVLDDGKTCLITYGTETRPGQVVEKIRLDAFIDFEAGDKPRFSTGIVDPIVDTDHQRWDANDGSGYGITSSEFWNTRYNGKLITEFEDGKSYTYGVYFKISDLGMEEGYRFDKNTKLCINGTEITLTPDQIDVDDNGETVWFSNVLTMTPTPAKVWQKIDVIEIEGATVNFKDGDKPVFTGKTPENAPYNYQFECWETKDGAGVNSAEYFDNAYEKHITAFESGKTYQYILYFKAEDGYYFTADTKIKINGTLYNYRLVNVDPDYDSSGRMYTFWAYTDLTMTPQASGTTPEYKITEGANGSWTQNSDGTLRFVANGDFSKFTGVKVDGTFIAADKYTAVSGSTVITLKKDYLSTLSSVGKHTLTVVYSDGECSTEFEIRAAQGGSNTTPDKPNQDDSKSPKTGDNSNLMLWAALLFISGGAVIGTTVVSKKKKHNS